MEKLGGVAYLKVDGEQIDLGDKCTYKPGITTKTPKIGLGNKVVGYTDMLENPPSIEVEAFNAKSLDLRALAEKRDMTVVIEFGDERSETLRNAVLGEVSEVDAKEGTVSLTFFGEEMEKVA